MPYIYRAPLKMDYLEILGGALRLPADIRLHRSDPANRRDYIQETVTAPLQGTYYFLPAIQGGSGAEAVRVAEAEYTITEGMSEAALEEELGALRREYWDRTFQVLHLVTVLTELWVGRVYPDVLYQLAFDLLAEIPERRNREEAVARDVVRRLGRDSRLAAQRTEEFVQRPWEGSLRDLDAVLADLCRGKLGERQSSVFGWGPVERGQIFQAFVITRRDAATYCQQHLIDPSIVTFGDDDIIFDLAGTADGIQLFRPVTQRRVLPGKLWERAPQWRPKGWSNFAGCIYDQRRWWSLESKWRKGTEGLAYPVYMGESDRGWVEEPFFLPNMPIGPHREEKEVEGSGVETRFFEGSVELTPEDVEGLCWGWWGREYKEYFVAFDGEEGWLPRESYKGLYS